MTTRSGAWTAVVASELGSSHERNNLPNQDAVRVVASRGPTIGLVSAVCDGHGGDRYVRSDVGSRIGVAAACAAGLQTLDVLVGSPQPSDIARHLAGPLTESIVTAWQQAVHADVAARDFTAEEVDRAGVALADEPLIAYGCTLVLAVVAEHWIGIVQIGDGDVTTVADSDVHAPVPTDARLVGGETTSLCLPSAVADARTCVLIEPLPEALILTTDGYANSFASPDWRTSAGLDLRHHAATLGMDTIEALLPGWLAESAAVGGDDVSMAFITRLDAAG